jgi:multisubunit Na+/H+ antiporter MnhG subunit
VTRQIIADALLGLAVLVVAASALGVLTMPDAYQKLHYVTPAAVVAPALTALAIGVQEGLNSSTGQTCVALFFLVVAGPFLSHATIRAIRVREHGDWRLKPAERAEPEPEKAREKTP